MLDMTTIIKILWYHHKGDTRAIMGDLGDLRDSPGVEKLVESKRDLAEKFFDDQETITFYDSEFATLGHRVSAITSTHSSYSSYGVVPPTLIRWNKYVGDCRTKYVSDFKDRLLHKYQETVFILDSECTLTTYNIPEGILAVFGTLYPSGIIHLYNERKELLLMTSDPEEAFWFIIMSCQFLLVGSRGQGGAGLPAPFEQRLLLAYHDMSQEGGANRCNRMAIPGKRGCLANQCLKQRGQFQFVESWDDIATFISNSIKED